METVCRKDVGSSPLTTIRGSTKRKIVDLLLENKELTLRQLAERLGFSRMAISHHLDDLVRADVLTERFRPVAHRHATERVVRIADGIKIVLKDAEVEVSGFDK